MKVLFDIRGRQIICETDNTLPVDTVRVRSIDAFAALLQGLDMETLPAPSTSNGTEPFVVTGKSGKAQPIKTRKSIKKDEARARAIAIAESLKGTNAEIAPTPPGGWRTANGSFVILSNFGPTREEIAQAINEKSDRLTDDQLKLLALRFGIGKIQRPHSTMEIGQMLYPQLDATKITPQAKVSAEVKSALKRLGFRLRKRNVKRGRSR